MTESEWLERGYPFDLLEHLWISAPARKLRLFACACCRHPDVWRLLHQGSRELVNVVERFADEASPWEEVAAAAQKAARGPVSGGSWRSPNPVRLPPSSQAERAVLALAQKNAREAAWGTTREALNLIGPAAAELLREIFGNPFRPPEIAPASLAWQGGTVVKLARQIYEVSASLPCPSWQTPSRSPAVSMRTC